MSYLIEQAAEKDYSRIKEVWEASVLASHDFLDKDYFLFIRSNFISYLEAVTLYCIRDNGVIVAFIGIAGDKIEMLFVHPSFSGQGLGKRLIRFAIEKEYAVFVDVNEQNEQALMFYRKMGFVVTGRDELDGAGRPYPILHMKLNSISNDFVS